MSSLREEIVREVRCLDTHIEILSERLEKLDDPDSHGAIRIRAQLYEVERERDSLVVILGRDCVECGK